VLQCRLDGVMVSLAIADAGDAFQHGHAGFAEGESSLSRSAIVEEALHGFDVSANAGRKPSRQ